MKKFKSACRLIVVLFFLLAILIVSGCENHKPVKIGFVAGLSGRFSDIGGAARDGALLAVDEINRQGGVNGRSVEISFKDDRQNADFLRKGLDELRAEGVKLVIGPLTSQMGMAAVDATKDHSLVFVSPTVSTSLLSGLDDNFFRIYPQSDQLVDRLAQYLIDQTPLRGICMVADTSNAAFTLPSVERFEATFTILGGTVLTSQTFHSDADPKFYDVAKEINNIKCEGVVAFASAADLAMICQQLAKLDIKLPVFTTEWAYSKDLIEMGGKPVEGVTLVHTYNLDDQTAGSRLFVRSFEEKFGYTPNFSALHGFDATKLALTALQTGTGSNLQQALKTTDEFEGVQARIRFDEYGDVLRDIFLSIIVDGRFVQKQDL